jgi:hypothetical protein
LKRRWLYWPAASTDLTNDSVETLFEGHIVVRLRRDERIVHPGAEDKPKPSFGAIVAFDQQRYHIDLLLSSD